MLGSLLLTSAPKTWTAFTLTGLGAITGAGICVLLGFGPWQWKSEILIGNSPVFLYLDALGAFFLILVGLVAAAGTVYAYAYWPDSRHPRSSVQGRIWWNTMILSMVTVLITANGLHFLFAWELFAVSAFFLITLDRGNPKARTAGWLYLASSHAGTVILFALFAALAVHTGTWELGSLRDVPELAPLFWLALFGFGVKAGIFPLHIWLPSAHANAPSHVSALLSGVALKIGLYGIIRFSTWLPLPPEAGWVILGMGCMSAVLGVAFAISQNDLKRLLAYSSVENIGIIFMGFGFGIVAIGQGMPYWGILALTGGFLHIWNHGLFKSLLFLGAGAVLHSTKTREMSRLGGLWKFMPWTTALFTLGSLSICGLPPLNGFVSEWLLYSSFLNASIFTTKLSLAAVAITVILSIASALVLACFIKVCGVTFLGAPRNTNMADIQECDWTMRGVMLALATICVTIGLFPTLVWPMLINVILIVPGTTLHETPRALYSLSKAHILLAITIVAVSWATLRFIRQRTHRALTWDCGFSNPSPRMQYTSGSFAGIITAWFASILRPVTYQLRPSSFFPAKATDLAHTPETVLRFIIQPLGRIFLVLGDWATGFQHGRMQSYIAYLFSAIVVLAITVALAHFF